MNWNVQCSAPCKSLYIVTGEAGVVLEVRKWKYQINLKKQRCFNIKNEEKLASMLCVCVRISHGQWLGDHAVHGFNAAGWTRGYCNWGCDWVPTNVLWSGHSVHRNIEKEIQETIGAGFEVQTAKRHPQDTKAVRGEGQQFVEWSGRRRWLQRVFTANCSLNCRNSVFMYSNNLLNRMSKGISLCLGAGDNKEQLNGGADSMGRVVSFYSCVFRCYGL